MRISLSPEECHLAVIVASTRQTSAALKKSKDSVDAKTYMQNFSAHLQGCFGEIAVSKALRVPWPAWIDRFTSVSDLETNIEVRHRSRDDRELIVRPNDDKNKFYVLSTGEPERITVWGYIRGKDAMRKEWAQTHGGKREAFFVPKEHLEPIGILERIIHGG